MNEQLTVKDFFKFVEEFKKGREIDSATQQATLKAIQGLGNKISKTNERVTTKEEPAYQPSFKERLMSGVATAKSIGSGIKSIVKNPVEAIKTGGTAIGTKIADAEIAMEKYVGDILSAPKDFKLPTSKESKESKNPEADNIETPDEIAADAAKDNVELSKQILDTNEEALTELKLIGKALTGTTPAIGSKKPSSSASVSPQPPQPPPSDGPGMGVNIDLPDRKPKPEAPPKKEGKPGGKAAGAVGKGIGKSLIKKIPLVGAVAGLGFGAYRLMQGDTAGAAMEVASGVAGSIPGVGTAASVGIDAALAAKDAKAAEAAEATPTPSAAAPAPMAAPAPTAQPAEKQAPVSKPSKPKEETAKIEKKKEKGGDVFLTPDQEKAADPLIAEMLTLSNQIKDLNNDFSIPKDEKKTKRSEIVKKQEALVQQLDKIKPDLGFHVLQYSSAMDIDASKETSKSLTEKMKQDFKVDSAPKQEEAKAKPAEKASGEKVLSSKTITEKSSKISGETLTDEAKSAREQKLGLQEKYAQKAAPIVKKLFEEGKIEDRFATEEDYEKIPELAALRKEQQAEAAKLSDVEKAGTSYFSKEVSSISSDNQAMKDEMSAGGSTQPIVSNNVSSTSTNNFMPMKADPRPTHRGSALDRYNERVAAY